MRGPVVCSKGSSFLCDVLHSGTAQSGGRASWDTKIGFVLLSPRRALTHSASLPLVSCVFMVNKQICVVCARRSSQKFKFSFSSLFLSHFLIASYLPVHALVIAKWRLVPHNLWSAKKNPNPILHAHKYIFLQHSLTLSLHLPHFETWSAFFFFFFDVCNIFFPFPFPPTICNAAGEIWPPVSVAGSVLRLSLWDLHK